MVNATNQAKIARKILPLLSDKENEIFLRGRNISAKTSSKVANIVDYRVATGLECLIGYLYISRNEKRLTEILDFVFSEENSVCCEEI